MFEVKVLLMIVYLSTSCINAHSHKHDGKGKDDKLEIPRAMSLETFMENYVTSNVTMSELYYVLPNPKPYEPKYNYQFTYTEVSEANGTIYSKNTSSPVQDGTIHEAGLADDLEKHSCFPYETYLTPVDVDNGNKKGQGPAANFVRTPDGQMQTMWSSNPDKYLLSLRCSGWKFPNKFCNKSNVTLGFYIPFVGRNGPDNLPWASISNDLKKAKLLFGSEFFWAFTYGDSTKCPRRRYMYKIKH